MEYFIQFSDLMGSLKNMKCDMNITLHKKNLMEGKGEVGNFFFYRDCLDCLHDVLLAASSMPSYFTFPKKSSGWDKLYHHLGCNEAVGCL